MKIGLRQQTPKTSASRKMMQQGTPMLSGSNVQSVRSGHIFHVIVQLIQKHTSSFCAPEAELKQTLANLTGILLRLSIS